VQEEEHDGGAERRRVEAMMEERSMTVP